MEMKLPCCCFLSLFCCGRPVSYAAVLKIKCLYLFSAVCRIIPRTPQEIASPIPTVSIINGIGSGT